MCLLYISSYPCSILDLAAFSLGLRRVTRVLERAISEVRLVHIQPGRPMQNGHVESFHGRLRDECLNTSWFHTLANWRREYNEERPHGSLDYRTPEEFQQRTGYADVESKQRFPHPHSLDDGDENKSQSKTRTGNSSYQGVRKRGQVRNA